MSVGEVQGAVSRTDVDKWDVGLTKMAVGLTHPIVKRYFREEMKGIENIPSGPSLVVSNHSGGLLPPDRSVFAVAYYDTFGYERPPYTLGHDTCSSGQQLSFSPVQE